MFFEDFVARDELSEHIETDRRRCALQMRRWRGEGKKKRKRREAFTCRVDSILGPAAMFRLRVLQHASIQTLFIQCSAVFSFLLNVAASSVRTASSPGFGHPTPAT